MSLMMKKALFWVWALFIAYLVLVLCNTVICRETFSEYQYSLIPFWSYHASINGKSYLITENLLNIVLFIPIGFFLGVLNRNKNSHSWWTVLGVVLLISICIEFLQLVFKKGFCEFDDLFHNSLGGLLGYYLSHLFVNKMKSKNFH